MSFLRSGLLIRFSITDWQPQDIGSFFYARTNHETTGVLNIAQLNNLERNYFFHSQMLNGAGIFNYIYPKNGPNVGRYSIHGASGIYTLFSHQNFHFKGIPQPWFAQPETNLWRWAFSPSSLDERVRCRCPAGATCRDLLRCDWVFAGFSDASSIINLHISEQFKTYV